MIAPPNNKHHNIPDISPTTNNQSSPPDSNNNITNKDTDGKSVDKEEVEKEIGMREETFEEEHHKQHALKDFKKGPWLDPGNKSYGWGKHHQHIYATTHVITHELTNLEELESAFVTLADDKPANYKEVMNLINAEKWRASMEEEYETIMGYCMWKLIKQPLNVNIGDHDGHTESSEII